MRKVGLWGAMAFWLIAAAPSWGDAEVAQGTGMKDPASPPSASEQPGLPLYHDPPLPLVGDGGLTAQIYTALGTVLGLVALGVYLYKRVSQRGSRGAPPDGTIRLLSRTYLGPKESLCLVQVGRQVLLLGQTSARITLLHSLGTPSPEPSGVRVEGDAESHQPDTSEERARAGSRPWSSSIELNELKDRLQSLNRKWGLEA